METLRSSWVRSLLAVDAVATALAGLVVAVRPDWFAPPARAVPGMRALRAPELIRRVGALVAGFGVLKGLAYALALYRSDRRS
jgi:allantoicase